MMEYACFYAHDNAWNGGDYDYGDNVISQEPSITFIDDLFFTMRYCTAHTKMSQRAFRKEDSLAIILQMAKKADALDSSQSSSYFYIDLADEENIVADASITPILENGERLPSIKNKDRSEYFSGFSDIEKANLERMVAFEISVSFGGKTYSKIFKKGELPNDAAFGDHPVPAKL